MRVLAIGAHPDDVELGCGATLGAHRAAGHRTDILVVTGGGRSRGAGADRRRLEQDAAARLLGCHVHWGGLIDCDLPPEPVLIGAIESVLDRVYPDVIYVPSPHDGHQDHRAVSRATVSAARRSTRVLYYQSPTTLSFDPTVFIDVAEHLDAKLEALACHRSQIESGSVRLDVIAASARHWGAIARVEFAEAFEPLRLLWDFGVPDRAIEPVDLSPSHHAVEGDRP